jgi:hypothetical protein
MQRGEITPGVEYALREGKQASDLQHVRVIEHVRAGRWRVEWLDPNPGLVDFVKSGALVCRWAERRAFERDEQNAAQIRDAVDLSWPGPDHPLNDAAQQVIEATGEDATLWKGILSGPPDAASRIAARASHEIPPHVGYADSRGERHLPWDVALELAKRFAAAEPRTVLLHIEATEREWEIKAAEQGGSYILPLLEQSRAAWALVRQWASFDADRARLDAEIDRLRQLVTRAVWDLRASGVDPQQVAGRLERGLRGE